MYPQGTSGAQLSGRVKGLAVLLYLLGLSYGAVSLALEALGVRMVRSYVYALVQQAASRVPDLKWERVCEGVKTAALGADLTSVKCKGKWVPLGSAVDPLTGLVLSVDARSAEDTQTLKDGIEPIAHSIGAQVLVTDDADGFKTIADEIGTQHQVCKSHVKRNTEALIERLQPLGAQDADGSLVALGVSCEQAAADLHRLGELIRSRRREEGAELEALHRR